MHALTRKPASLQSPLPPHTMQIYTWATRMRSSSFPPPTKSRVMAHCCSKSRVSASASAFRPLRVRARRPTHLFLGVLAGKRKQHPLATHRTKRAYLYHEIRRTLHVRARCPTLLFVLECVCVCVGMCCFGLGCVCWNMSRFANRRGKWIRFCVKICVLFVELWVDLYTDEANEYSHRVATISRLPGLPSVLRCVFVCWDMCFACWNVGSCVTICGKWIL